MKVARLFVSCLENEGVQTIFGIPGEENIDVMESDKIPLKVQRAHPPRTSGRQDRPSGRDHF